MTLAGWSLANPAALWLAALALPIIALHVLRPRRIQAVVPALFLWRRVATPVTAARPWQRLTPSWLLAAQIATALLLALLVARPVKITDAPLSDHTIFVIDASASMQALDGSPDRLTSAVERAVELRDQVPAGGEASIVVAGSRSRAILTHSTDVGAFSDALGTISAASSRADFAGAFALAAGLDTGELPTQVVLISDGGVTDADLRTAPVGTRYERVGTSATNRAITQLSVEPTSGGLLARVTVTHFGGPDATQTLRIDIDGRTIDQRSISLAAGEVANETFELPLGTKVEAFLESEDVLDLDDRAVATVARRPELEVLVVGSANAFLDAALQASPGVSFDRVATVPDTISSDTDVVIFDRARVPADINHPLLAIAPPDGITGVPAAGTVERPALTFIDATTPLLRDLDLSQVRIAEAQQLEPEPTAQVLLGAEGAPLLVTVDRPGSSAVILAFELDQTTLPLQAAFPVLIDRIVTDLARAVTPPARLTVGQDLPIDVRLEANVTSPLGTSFAVPAGSSIPAADRIGFWTVAQEGRADIIVAVNSDRSESNIAPAPDLPFEEAFEGQREPSRGEQPLIVPFALAGLALLAVEWLLARRRVGVAPTQWRVAQGIRVAVALALVAVLLAPSVDRSTDRVATVFLVDASDSVGVDGSLQARALVRAAIDDQPDGSLAGVVAFGGDARLESLVVGDADFAGVTVIVDPTATDLSAAMRLGAAALPEDARGRLVLLSDGRATTGDASEEAERLAADGIPLDVMVLDPASGNDVAVESLDVPPLARAGEAVPVTVRLASPVRVEAEVTLRRGDTVVGSETLTLEPGINPVTFVDTADDLGVLRYQVDVAATGDGVPANDLGFAAVPVEGAARVLVVDGRPGAGDGIVAALEAGEIGFDRVAPGRIPAIDELAQYASILLVDVDRRDLADRQVQDLTAAVRDLGRGMVVIGGTHSYALGGYRDSDLEEILPVISEITDPLRRQTVAEVLAIDTSGSMDACHCDEEGNNGLGGGNRIGGGVSKTAIARNAAARAIGALGATDEVGVLSVDANDTWLIDLQARPPQDVIDEGLSQLVPEGPTFVDTVLSTSADALRQSDASLRHIIFFSDGFTEPSTLVRLADEAAELLEEGITVSVVATGEGAAEDLRPIADAGGGRFYPGTNLEQLPDIIVQEAILASRDFVNEGDFAPVITSSAPTVASLTEAPRLRGYVATTAKPTSRVDLRIGPDEDPLLASWRIGLGRVTAWTSDGNDNWAAPWAGWDGAPDQWAAIIKETFPVTSDGGVNARIEDGQLELRLEGTDDWDDSATATVRVATPSGDSIDVPLERLDGSTFAATVAVDEAGTYAVGGTVSDGDEVVWSGIGLTSRSYPAEYAPRPVGRATLERLAVTTGGRIDPLAAELFDPDGTRPGSRRIDLAPWLLLFAVLAWPVAVAVSRLAWRRGVLAVGTNRAAATVQKLRRTALGPSGLPRIAEPDGGSGNDPDGSDSGTRRTRQKSSSTSTYVDDSVASASPLGGSTVPTAPPPAGTPSAPPASSPSDAPADSDAPTPSPDRAATLDELLRRKRENRDR